MWVCGECKRPFPRQFIVERHIKHKHFWKPNLKEAFFSLPLEDMVDNVPSVSVKNISLSLFIYQVDNNNETYKLRILRPPVMLWTRNCALYLYLVPSVSVKNISLSVFIDQVSYILEILRHPATLWTRNSAFYL